MEKITIWSCIFYWKRWISIAMLVYWMVWSQSLCFSHPPVRSFRHGANRCWGVAQYVACAKGIKGDLETCRRKLHPGRLKWVFPKIGDPKWMVKIMENPIKNGWFGGTIIFGNTQMEPTNHPFGKENDLKQTSRELCSSRSSWGFVLLIVDGWNPAFASWGNGSLSH